MAALKRAIVVTFQATVNFVSRYPILKVDGIIGPATVSAYSALKGAARDVVDSLVVKPSPFLRSKLDGGRNPLSKLRFFSRGDTFDAMKVAENLTDVPLSFLNLMVQQENFVHTNGYDAGMSGNYRGLAQIGKSTWESLQKAPYGNVLTWWEEGVKDAKQSMIAAGLLYKANKVDFLRQYPARQFTDDIAYLFHQQGTPSALSWLKDGVLKHPYQSTKSLAMFETLRRNFTSV
jgi:hypothetical protein